MEVLSILNLIICINILIRAHLKNRIFVQGQGGTEFQTAGILKYVEDLKREPNGEIGPKDIFEMNSSVFCANSKEGVI